MMRLTAHFSRRRYVRLAQLCIGFTAFARFAWGADPALTIYNQDFAVIRESLPLDLKAGNNTVRFTGATAQVEPDSVILRDPAGAHPLRIVEQNYRNDPVSQDLLLNLFEGKTVEFAVRRPDGSTGIVTGKIVRSGYVPHYQAMNRYGSQYAANQMSMVSGGAGQPIIEVDGKLQFSLPGEPMFPALGDDTILKPTLDWILNSAQAARFDAELSYISGGLSWSSDYNIVAPETGDTLDLVAWVTLDNQCGKQFDHAHIKLMAGDVNKEQPQGGGMAGMGRDQAMLMAIEPKVTEKAFEDYHLYTLPLPTTLHDRETKQVEFLRASGIQSKRLYIYDGFAPDRRYGIQDLRNISEFGVESNPHVWVIREFVNSEANHLGVPLPAGRLRFYRRDHDGQVEFTGENRIDHTPKDETVRVYTGNAFDITGERRQTHFSSEHQRGLLDESFEIKLRNHKKEAATVRVVEHLYRWSTWSISQESQPHRQVDSRTIEYEVTLQPDEEKVVTYTAHYTW
ncbi:MAG: DUF4139 domain-containing protein [Bryobacteraceae bacterium]